MRLPDIRAARQGRAWPPSPSGIKAKTSGRRATGLDPFVGGTAQAAPSRRDGSENQTHKQQALKSTRTQRRIKLPQSGRLSHFDQTLHGIHQPVQSASIHTFQRVTALAESAHAGRVVDPLDNDKSVLARSSREGELILA